MTDHEAFDDRRRALEEQFFRSQDQKLVASMKAAAEKKELKEGLRGSSGITDEAVLDKLAEMKISAQTLAALSIVPLVEVAWCDGALEPKEKEAILKAAAGLGIPAGSSAYGLLMGWLAKAPPLELLEAWESYTKMLCERCEGSAREKLKNEIIGRATKVAEASGGFLGLMSKISDAERRMLDRLAKSF
jgi:hypothetical protein